MTSDPIGLHVKGPFACFTRAEFHVERVSYPVITPSAACDWAWCNLCSTVSITRGDSGVIGAALGGGCRTPTARN
jgi:CRISPR-associated Cas5-like protein